jgi:hypothetical protein
MRAYATRGFVCQVTRRVALTSGRSLTQSANYQRGQTHHSHWHSDIRNSNQLNILICVECLTSLTLSFLLDQELPFRSMVSILQEHKFLQSPMLNYPAYKLVPGCQIQNLEIPCYERLSFLPNINVPIFVIIATFLYISYYMLGGLL